MNQPTRSYLAVAAAIVIAGVLVSASLFVAVGQAPKTTTTTTTATTTSISTSISTITTISVTTVTATATSTTTTTIVTAGENCPASYDGFMSADSNQTNPAYPILSMPTNSNAVVCVTYYNPTNETKTLDLGGSLGVEIGSFYSQTTAPNTIYTTFNQSSDFTVTPSAASVVLPPNTSKPQTVAFLIHSDSGSKGFFFLNVDYLGPESCAMGMPLAVGYTLTSQNTTGAYFNPEGQEPLCIIQFTPMAHADVFGFIGIQQTYVNCGGWICDLTSY